MNAAGAIPPLGLSTGGLSHFDAHDLVLMGIELGIRHVVTSPDDDNESAVGGALAASEVDRSSLFVTSTIGCHGGDRDRLFDSFDVTLDLLGLRELDLLLLRSEGPHAPRSESEWVAACEALHGLKEEGVVLRIGLALANAAEITALSRHAPFEVVQMTSHPFLSQRRTRQWCTERGWGFIADAPFGREGEADLVLGNTVVTGLAIGHGVSPEQVALAWAVSTPGSAVAIPCSSPDELFDRWESRRLELAPEEILAIDGLDPSVD